MKVGIYTLGCKVNSYETAYIINKLKEANYEIVDFNDKADIYIINTCTVTNTSDAKSRKMISSARKKNGIVVVMGCYSQIKAIEADIVIGNKDKSKIVELIEEYLSNKEKIKRIYNLNNEVFEDMSITTFDNRTRAFVKIQDGCNAYCSYCVIPYVRGNIRSKKADTVLKEITSLVNNGYKEIVLTGIHTGKYGMDIDSNLTSLLKEIIKINNLYRVRISSIEINEVTDEIIDMLENNILAKHLHIPLQSGCNKILKLMNRKYDLNYYESKINLIREKFPDISITTDLIVGFPNETDDDFNDTLEFIKKIRFSKIHVFPYSKRDGTKSSLMINEVDSMTKKTRVREVINLSNELEREYNKLFLNKEIEVLIEEVSGNSSIGHTSNYLKVLINSVLECNRIYKVKIVDVSDVIVGVLI